MIDNNSVARLFVLDYGLFEVHDDRRRIGIQGYLIQMQEGQNILVDTGFPAKYAADPEKATHEDSLQSFGRVVSLTLQQLPAGQLAKIGLAREEIDLLIMTHSDIDHVGGLPDFAHVPIVIGAEDRAQPHPRYWAGRSPIAWPEAEYRTIEHDTDLLPGIRVLTTPGHAPGHLSLLIRLPESGAVLICGDAISRPAELSDGFSGAWDSALAQESAQKLVSIARSEGAFIIYGHDPEQWPTLRKAPDCYR